MDGGSSESSDSMPKGKGSRTKRKNKVLLAEADEFRDLPTASCSNEPGQDIEDDVEDTKNYNHEDTMYISDEDTNYYNGHEPWRFDSFSLNVYTFILVKMRTDWENLLSVLESEKLSYGESVWRVGPNHLFLKALLHLLDLSPEEWSVCVPRMDPATRGLSLTSDQEKWLKRFEAGAGTFP